MAIIIGRRDDGALISTAGPVAVPQKSPTQEFAQGISAMTTAYSLGKTAVTDAADLTLVGARAVGKGIDAAKRVNWQNAYDQEYGRLKGDADRQEYIKQQHGMMVEDPKVDLAPFSAPAQLAPSTTPSAPPAAQPMKAGGPAQAATPRGSTEPVVQVPAYKPVTGAATGVRKKLDAIAAAPMDMPTDPGPGPKKLDVLPAPLTREEEWDARARMYANQEVGSVESYGMGDYVDRMRQAVSKGDDKAVQAVFDDYDRYGTEDSAATTAWEWLTGSADRKQREKLEKMVSITPSQAALIETRKQTAALKREHVSAAAFANANRAYDRTIKLAQNFERLKGNKLDNRKKLQELITAGRRSELELKNLLSVTVNRDRRTELQRQITNLRLRMEPYIKRQKSEESAYWKSINKDNRDLVKAKSRQAGRGRVLDADQNNENPKYTINPDGSLSLRKPAQEHMEAGSGTPHWSTTPQSRRDLKWLQDYNQDRYFIMQTERNIKSKTDTVRSFSGGMRRKSTNRTGANKKDPNSLLSPKLPGSGR